MSSVYKWLNKEKQRFYTITIKKEIPEFIQMHYVWGSCNSKRGGNKYLFVSTDDEAISLIKSMIKRRKNRGYELINHF